jgi:hypothetical protein
MSLNLNQTSQAIFDRALNYELPNVYFHGLHYIPFDCTFAFDLSLQVGFRVLLRYDFLPSSCHLNPFEMAQLVSKDIKNYFHPMWC